MACRAWRMNERNLLWLRPSSSADALWAAEQILKNGSCGAVVLWQSNVRAESLRRLNLAAQSTDTWLWLMPPWLPPLVAAYWTKTMKLLLSVYLPLLPLEALRPRWSEQGAFVVIDQGHGLDDIAASCPQRGQFRHAQQRRLCDRARHRHPGTRTGKGSAGTRRHRNGLDAIHAGSRIPGPLLAAA